jgi:hypothetical protein
VRVLFWGPRDAPAGWWTPTELWRAAEALPDARVGWDVGGAEARRFGARTSGHVVLYDRAGRLLFQGGVTAARGQAGDNAGKDAVIALLTQGRAERAATPVFGCPFGDPPSEAE